MIYCRAPKLVIAAALSVDVKETCIHIILKQNKRFRCILCIEVIGSTVYIIAFYAHFNSKIDEASYGKSWFYLFSSNKPFHCQNGKMKLHHIVFHPDILDLYFIKANLLCIETRYKLKHYSVINYIKVRLPFL